MFAQLSLSRAFPTRKPGLCTVKQQDTFKLCFLLIISVLLRDSYAIVA